MCVDKEGNRAHKVLYIEECNYGSYGTYIISYGIGFMIINKHSKIYMLLHILFYPVIIFYSILLIAIGLNLLLFESIIMLLMCLFSCSCSCGYRHWNITTYTEGGRSITHTKIYKVEDNSVIIWV